jgi:hypothetical protein
MVSGSFREGRWRPARGHRLGGPQSDALLSDGSAHPADVKEADGARMQLWPLGMQPRCNFVDDAFGVPIGGRTDRVDFGRGAHPVMPPSSQPAATIASSRQVELRRINCHATPRTNAAMIWFWFTSSPLRWR